MSNTPAVPTAAETAETVKLLERSRDELVAYCATLAPGDWNHSDGPGRWTPAEILEHLVIVEHGFRRRLDAMLAAPAEPDWQARTADKDAILPEVAEVREPVNAPPPLHPGGKIAAAESLAAFQAARLQAIAFARQPGVAFKEHTFDHPVMGALNGQQCLRTLGYHTLRHLGQMKRCGRAAGPPA